MKFAKKLLSMLLVLALMLSVMPMVYAYDNLGGGRAAAKDLEDLEEALASKKIMYISVEDPITISHDLTIPMFKTVVFKGKVTVPAGVTLTVDNQDMFTPITNATVHFTGGCQLDGVLQSKQGIINVTLCDMTGSGKISGRGSLNVSSGSSGGTSQDSLSSGRLIYSSVDVKVDNRMERTESLSITNTHFNQVKDFSGYDSVVVLPAPRSESRVLTITKNVSVDNIHFNCAVLDEGIAYVTMNIENGGCLTVNDLLSAEGLKINVKEGGRLVIEDKCHLNGENTLYNVPSELLVEKGGELVVNGSLTVAAAEEEGARNATLIIKGDAYGDGVIESRGETRVCGTCTVEVEGALWAPFLDTKVGAWYHDSIVYGVEHHLFEGIDHEIFGVDDNMSRVQLILVLYRMENEPNVDGYDNPFKDIKPGKYYEDAVKWAYHNEIVTGVTSTRFEPHEDISREHVALILYRYAMYKGMDVSASQSLKGFPDADDVSSYARSAMKWAVATGLINGSKHHDDGKSYLEPGEFATRAQLATIIHRFAIL